MLYLSWKVHKKMNKQYHLQMRYCITDTLKQKKYIHTKVTCSNEWANNIERWLKSIKGSTSECTNVILYIWNIVMFSADGYHMPKGQKYSKMYSMDWSKWLVVISIAVYTCISDWLLDHYADSFLCFWTKTKTQCKSV